MTAWLIAASVAVALTANGAVRAQSTGAAGSSQTHNAIDLVDSTGNVAAKPLNETIMLVGVSSGVVAPALIRPIYDADGHIVATAATVPFHFGVSADAIAVVRERFAGRIVPGDVFLANDPHDGGGLHLQDVVVMLVTALAARGKSEAHIAAADFLCQDLARKLTGKRPSDRYFRDANKLADLVIAGGFEQIAGVPREEILMKYAQ